MSVNSGLKATKVVGEPWKPSWRLIFVGVASFSHFFFVTSIISGCVIGSWCLHLSFVLVVP